VEEEYILDTPRVRTFIAEVRAMLAQLPVAEALDRLRPAFAELLADPNWLPQEYQLPAEQSGMGGGIATWLLYRAADGDLSLFSLVVPPNSATPVHDHLAWGLVGLYTGEQEEVVYQHQGSHGETHAELAITERNHLRPGDFYVLLPPDGDIHGVATVSEVPSVSIHLLGNDTGCVWRHAYTPEENSVRAFRSGWSNVPCRNENP
jgi:3-mercaptopropionate dioxygenase